MDNISEAIREKAEDNRISCKNALDIAEHFQVSPAVVGKACNELKLKIMGCQLGCFK